MEGAKTAIVLGGGGALGWVYHAGVLAAFGDMGADLPSVHLMIGTSAGAAVAASARAGASPEAIVHAMSRGPSAEDRERMLAEIRATRKSLRPLAPRLARQAVHARANPVMALAGLLPRGLFPTAFTEQFPGIPDLDGWPEGLWIPSVRASDGHVVVFGRDRRDVSVADAVAASSAVPGMFQPKRIGNNDYIDGGVVSPTHAELACDAGAEAVVISSPMTRPSRRFLARHARKVLAKETRNLRKGGVRVLVVQPTERLMEVADGFPRRNPLAAGAIAEQARADVAAAVEKAGL